MGWNGPLLKDSGGSQGGGGGGGRGGRRRPLNGGHSGTRGLLMEQNRGTFGAQAGAGAFGAGVHETGAHGAGSLTGGAPGGGGNFVGRFSNNLNGQSGQAVDSR